MARRVGKVANIRVVEICHFSRSTGAVDVRLVEWRADCSHDDLVRKVLVMMENAKVRE